MVRKYYQPDSTYEFVTEVLENANRCAAQASPFFVHNTKYFRQCSRNRGYGPGGEFCAQHAKHPLMGKR